MINEYSGENTYSLNFLVSEVLDCIENIFESKDKCTQQKWCLDTLDIMVREAKSIISNDVSNKSLLTKEVLCKIILNKISIFQELPVVIFTHGVPRHELAMRMLVYLSNVDPLNIYTGKIADNDWPSIALAANQLSTARIFIDDADLSLEDIRKHAKYLKNKLDAKFMVTGKKIEEI